MCIRCPCCFCDCVSCSAVVPTEHAGVRVTNTWRNTAKENSERSLILEALFSILPPLPELNYWVIEPESYQNQIVGVVNGKKLHEFTALVRELSSVLGPPVRFAIEDAYETRTPDFKAIWHIKNPASDDFPTVVLRSERPECKMDPRTEYKGIDWTAQKQPQLHPECIKALESLKEEIEEDYEAKGQLYVAKPHGHEMHPEFVEQLTEHEEI